jgi:Protein of unknown function (DUF402)
VHVRAGDIVLLRSIFGGNVRWCVPNRYVDSWNGRHGLYCQPGNQAKVMNHDLERWISDAPPFDHTWERAHVLRFMREGDCHTVELMWDEAWHFVGWYVNLQAPLVIKNGCFDTTDWALDVVVDPDGTWHWKDEDELARLVTLGAFTERQAVEIRAEGERVIEEAPWPTEWEDWRPPAEWTPLGLPRDWHVV